MARPRSCFSNEPTLMLFQPGCSGSPSAQYAKSTGMIPRGVFPTTSSVFILQRSRVLSFRPPRADVILQRPIRCHSDNIRRVYFAVITYVIILITPHGRYPSAAHDNLLLAPKVTPDYYAKLGSKSIYEILTCGL